MLSNGLVFNCEEEMDAVSGLASCNVSETIRLVRQSTISLWFLSSFNKM